METESYVYKKEVDWSVLMEGFTLPIENQVVFLQNMGRFLQRGESKIIDFYMEGKTYDVKIININNSVEKRKKDAYQIRYTRNGEFSQALQVGFKRSMDYIRAIREGVLTNPRKTDGSNGTYIYDIKMEKDLPEYLQYDFGLTKE